MAVNWTKEQQQVIESRNRNLLVSAAAGSGKTAVLVERIIQMITSTESPMDIDRLLVMTFTKAAASEMRERIQAAIEKKLEENPQDAHLQQQAVMVQYAQITTIDSFCLHILREHFDCLEIDPSFRVGDEGELLLLKSDVMEELLEDYYENEKERFSRFVDAYAVGKADAGIGEYIEQVYTFSQSNPWPDEWLEKCRRELDNTTIEDFDQTEWMQFLCRDVRMQAEEWIEQLQEAAGLCREEDGPQPYLPMILSDLSQIGSLSQCQTYGELEAASSRICFPKLTAIRGKNSPVSPEKKEKVAECRKRVKKAVEKLKEEYLFEPAGDMMADMETGKEAIGMLLELSEEFARRYQEKKREKNLVDFSDLEHFALSVLLVKDGEGGERRASPAADEISSQYDEILVDEYQDSNLVQEALINSISRERFGHPNVFMVGDVKQSIYKFRLARPELFLDKYHSYQKEEGFYQKIELHQNFRSRSQVLGSINDIFFRIMTEKLGGIDYNEEAALHPGAQFEPEKRPQEFTTELLLLDTSESALEELDDDVSDYTQRELEANMIAGKIRSLTDEKDGFLVWDKEEKHYRTARFSDIVILLRSVSGWAETFTEVMSHQGIPAFAESRTGYFDTVEVETVLKFLAVVDNPIQDIPLAAVLKSPMGGVTDEEMAHLMALYKEKTEKTRDKGLYGAVMGLLEEGIDGENGILRRKVERIWKLILEFQKKAVYLPLHDLLYQIYDQTGYYDFVSAMPAGEIRKANLDMLVEKAAVYEATSYRGVFHFIRYIEKLRRYNTDFGEASVVDEQGNTVRIMSIHKSKGLEFPIVFLAGMGKLFNRQDLRGKVLIDSEFGIGVDYLDSEKRLKGPSLKKNVMKRRMELEALGEELRVLYVAMTRAKEKLFMTASSKNMESKLEKWKTAPESGTLPYTILSLAGSFLDWILMSSPSGSRSLTIRRVGAEQLLKGEIEEQISKKVTRTDLLNFDTNRVYNKDLRAKLERSFHFSYPYLSDVTLNTKMSVSEIKRETRLEEEEESAFLPTLPVFMEKEAGEKGGVTRGTAYHRAMELLPLSRLHTAGEVKFWLDRLEEEKKMTKEARALIRESDISTFLATPLGRRAARAEEEGRLQREKQFMMGIPARQMGDYDSDELVLIQGVIDAYFEEEDGLVLVDYKTDFVREAETLISRYRSQLDYYEKALSQITGKKVKEKYIYSYRLGAIPIG